MNLPPAAEACNPGSIVSVCSNTPLLNQMDGFSVNPRVMVCFSDVVDPATLSAGISLISLSKPLSLISLNQFFYHSDLHSHCAFAKPSNVLDQQSRYLLVITDAVHDMAGRPVTDDGGFGNALQSSSAYGQALAAAVNSLPGQLTMSGKVVSASLFTTMSATSWLEDVRNFIRDYAPSIVQQAGYPSRFSLADVDSLTWQADVGTGVMSQPIPISPLSQVGTVGEVAFGTFLSPNYLNPEGPAAGTITATDTKPVDIPQLTTPWTRGFVPVSFHVFFPAGPTPPGGWPVVIYGHGLGDSQFGAPTFIASTLAANGYATLAIEITGHGYGPRSKVIINTKSGQSFTVSTPGRGVPTSIDGSISSESGCVVLGAIAVRDCSRQATVDLLTLVKTMAKTNGLQLGLNPQRIYYVGQSLGSAYGTLFHALEPSVKAAVINVGGGSNVDVARLTPSGRQLSTLYLLGLNLLNVPPAPPENYFHDDFNDEYPYRDQLTLDTVPGSVAIQAAFESADWLGMLGDPLAYAPHLKASPLAGMPAKSTFFLYSWGDLEEPNPANSALIRAAEGQNFSWLFRFDWAAQSHPELLGFTFPDSPLPILPHRILSNPTIFNGDKAAEMFISLAEQQATADYFNSDGQQIPNPNQYLAGPFKDVTLFEQPATLPESLNFLQLKP